MHFDELWPNGPKFPSEEGSFRLSTDSVMLAAFASGLRAKKILDIGCGSGIITVLMQNAYPCAEVSGIDIQESSASLCRTAMEENGYHAAGICCGDIRNHRELYSAGSFDLCISNPPYFRPNSGYSAPDASRATARDERTLSLKELCEAARYLTKWGGAFCLVHRADRLADIICCLREQGLEPKRLRSVQHREGSNPSVVMVEARRGGKPGLSFEPPLILTNADGSDTAEAAAIYHRKAK